MCVNFINPRVVVIGGALASAGEHLITGIRESVYPRSLPLATANLRIAASRAGHRAAVLGASQLVSQFVLAPSGVEEQVSRAS